MILMAGHGGGAVFHQHQGQVMLVEQSVDDTGDAGVKKGGVTEKGDHRALIVE